MLTLVCPTTADGSLQIVLFHGVQTALNSEGEALGASHVVIYVPQHWDLTKSTIFFQEKPSKAAKPLQEGPAVIYEVTSNPLHPVVFTL